MYNFLHAIHAPEFPKGLEWYNCPNPLPLRSLKGKMVILFFWNCSCHRCLSTLPDLNRLEEKYHQELVIIGIHCPRPDREKYEQTIQESLALYRIEFPVVNDSSMFVLRTYDVRTLPALFLVDPKGIIVGSMSGEGIYSPMDDLITEILPTFDLKGLINRVPLKSPLEPSPTLKT